MGEKIIYYMKGDEVMSKISITSKQVDFINYTTRAYDCAFGIKTSPVGIKELNEFLELRCFPRSRGNSKELLEKLGLSKYDPIKIIEITNGIMIDDMYWIKFVNKDISYQELKDKWKNLL